MLPAVTAAGLPETTSWVLVCVRACSNARGGARGDAVLANLRTVNGDKQNGDRDVTYRPGEVALRMFDARG